MTLVILSVLDFIYRNRNCSLQESTSCFACRKLWIVLSTNIQIHLVNHVTLQQQLGFEVVFEAYHDPYSIQYWTLDTLMKLEKFW